MRQDHDVVADAWRSVCAGTDAPAVVVVSGGAGAGKSRHVAESLTRLTPGPAAVLIGGARANPAPYDWTATALHQYPLSGLPASAEALGWLTQDTQAPPLRLEPTSLLRAAVDVVRHLTAAGPSVIVAEDVHALDPASLALLGRLAESSGLSALLILVTRPFDADGYPKPAAQLVKRLAEGPARFVTFEPLPAHHPAGLSEIAWARYESARGDRTGATAAGLRAAARLLDSRQPDAAQRLLGELLGTGDDPARLVLARALLGLGRQSEAAAETGRAVAEGSADDVTRRLHTDLAALSDLTGREVEVLRCIAAGMSNRQIAKTLGISVRTVTVHVSNLLRKTGTGSRTEAAMWAVQQELRP